MTAARPLTGEAERLPLAGLAIVREPAIATKPTECAAPRNKHPYFAATALVVGLWWTLAAHAVMVRNHEFDVYGYAFSLLVDCTIIANAVAALLQSIRS